MADVNTCDSVSSRINYVIFTLIILIFVLLFVSWYLYGQYKEIRTTIVDPTQKVVKLVGTNVDQLKLLLIQLQAQQAQAPSTK